MPTTFTCAGCKGQMRVGDEMAGRKAKCSRCGAITSIPTEGGSAMRETPPPPARPAPRAARAANEFADLDAPAADPPSPRKRKRSPLLWVGLIGGGLLFSCCACTGIGVGVYFAFFRSSLPSEQKYLPDNCDVVASIRVGQLLDSKAYKQFQQELPELDKMIRQGEETSPVPLANIDQALQGTTAGAGTESVIVIRTKNAITAKEILDRKTATLKKLAGPAAGEGYKEGKVGNHTLYESKFDSFCVPESKVLLMGDPKVLRKVLERNGSPTISVGMEPLLKEASFSKTLVVAANLRDANVRKELSREVPVPGFKADDLFKEADGAVIQLDVGSNLDVEARIFCKDSKSAEEMRKLADGGIVTAKKKLQAGGMGPNAPPSELVEMIDSITIKDEQTRVVLTAQLKTDAVIKAAKLFQQMIPGR